MKLTKGLIKDVHPSDNPLGSWIDGRNKILSKKLQGVANEFGFLKLSNGYNTLNNKITVGVIPVAGSNGKFIVFSVICDSNGNVYSSEIGTCDANNNFAYTIFLDINIDTNNDLAFSPEHQISGEAMINANGEIVCAFTDNFNKPKCINFSEDYSVNWDIKRTLLFPESNEVTFSSEILDGGNLSSGAYFFIFRYRGRDNTYTNYGSITEPHYIFEDVLNQPYSTITGSLKGGLPTGKSVKFNLSNVDLSYTHLCVSVIKVENSVTYAYESSEIPINNTNLEYLFTGDNLIPTELISLINKYESYNTVKSFTTINQQLYAANVNRKKEFKFQKYANLISILVKSELVNDFSTVNDSAKTHENNSYNNSLMHDEVYAIYVAPVFKDNTIGYLYHIPGRDYALISQSTGDNNHQANEIELVANIKNDLDYSNLGLDDTVACDDDILGNEVRYFQTRNCAIYTGANNIIIPSFWQNENEFYPNSDEYDSTGDYDGTDISSLNPSKAIDYRGEKVKHHRMPDITWLKNNLYSSEDNYGYNKFDKLNLIIQNLVVPQPYQDIIQGFKFYFAKKNPDNSLVLCNDIMHYMGHDYNSGSPIRTGHLNTGGNFDIIVTTNSIWSPATHTGLERVKCHSADLLLNKPQISPSFVKQHLRLFYKFDTPTYGFDILEQGGTNCVRGYVNYFEEGFANWGANSLLNNFSTNYNYMVRKIDYGQYIPNNAIIPINGINVNNLNSEEAYHFIINNSNLSNAAVIGSEYVSIGGTDYEDMNGILQTTGTVLYSLMNYRTNVHLNFDTQDEFIAFPKYYNLNDLSKVTIGLQSPNYYSNYYYVVDDFDVTGGDTVISDNCYLAYGLKGSIFYGNSYNQEGVRIMHRYLAPTRNNLSLRSLSNTVYGNYFPKVLNPNWMDNLESQYNPEIGYDKDYSKRLDFESHSGAFNISNKYIEHCPKRILRATAKENTQQFESWKEFLNNNYYELKSNYDEIINIQGLSNGELLIHNQGLYKTRSITRIGTDGKDAALGTGDLFEFPPQAIADDTFGALGTQHKHACKFTPLGYVSIDSKTGLVYLLTDSGLKIISNDGVRNFFKEYGQSNKNGYAPFYIDDNPITYNGYNIEYDERWNRLIFSKKDYVPKDSFVNTYKDIFTTDLNIVASVPMWTYANNYNNDRHIFWKDPYKFCFVYSYYIADDDNIVDTYIRPDDGDYFDNKSFTLSYSLDYNCWAFFHDYVPDYIFRLRNNILLSVSSYNAYPLPILLPDVGHSNFYLHNYKENRCIYYNYDLVEGEQMAIPYKSFITPVLNLSSNSAFYTKEPSFLLHSLSWVSFLKEKNNDNSFLINKTFDRILLWNSNQASDNIDLIVLTNLEKGVYKGNIRKIKEKWMFNGFKNLVLDNQADFIQGGEFGIPYDVILSNISSSNTTLKPYYQNDRFMDRWVAVKLIYDNEIVDGMQYDISLTELEAVILPLKR